MGDVTVGAVQRAVRGMTLGTVKSFQAARERQWTGAIDEYDQQFQVPFSGKVGKAPVWTTFDVSFAVTFMYAPDERESPYPNPLFTYGIEFIKGHAFYTCGVLRWASNGALGVGGATIEVGALRPAARKPADLQAVLHLNFQGFGSPNQLPGEETDEDSETDLSGGEVPGAGQPSDIDIGGEPPAGEP